MARKGGAARLIHAAEVKGVVRLGQRAQQLREAAEHVAVRGGERVVGDRVLIGLEIGHVAQQEAQREAQLAVHVGHLRQDVGAHQHVA